MWVLKLNIIVYVTFIKYVQYTVGLEFHISYNPVTKSFVVFPAKAT
jgi:hypothetical protein